jgi:CspA family cold shock protein
MSRIEFEEADVPRASIAALAARAALTDEDVAHLRRRVLRFGFVTRGEGTEEIFIHMETLRRFGIMDLKPGDGLLVRFGNGPKGLMAAEIRPLETNLPISH